LAIKEWSIAGNKIWTSIHKSINETYKHDYMKELVNMIIKRLYIKIVVSSVTEDNRYNEKYKRIED
jgi:hypothetical protein